MSASASQNQGSGPRHCTPHVRVETLGGNILSPRKPDDSVEMKLQERNGFI